MAEKAIWEPSGGCEGHWDHKRDWPAIRWPPTGPQLQGRGPARCWKEAFLSGFSSTCLWGLKASQPKSPPPHLPVPQGDKCPASLLPT